MVAASSGSGATLRPPPGRTWPELAPVARLRNGTRHRPRRAGRRVASGANAPPAVTAPRGDKVRKPPSDASSQLPTAAHPVDGRPADSVAAKSTLVGLPLSATDVRTERLPVRDTCRQRLNVGSGSLSVPEPRS